MKINHPVTNIEQVMKEEIITVDDITFKEISFIDAEIEEIPIDIEKPYIPDLGAFNIELKIGDACSSCLSLINIYFSDRTFARLLKGSTVNIGKGGSCCLSVSDMGREIFFGNCQKENKDKGVFIPGCPPDYIESYRKLIKSRIKQK